MPSATVLAGKESSLRKDLSQQSTTTHYVCCAKANASERGMIAGSVIRAFGACECWCGAGFDYKL